MSASLTAAEWLAKWDDGETIPSVSMGGFSDDYEQAIQITAAEILRYLLEESPDLVVMPKEDMPPFWEKADRVVFKRLEPLGLSGERCRWGLSGAQYGAARNLAAIFYRRGPSEAMADADVADRIIAINNAKSFAEPHAACAEGRTP